jgi:hypothetical protein
MFSPIVFRFFPVPYTRIIKSRRVLHQIRQAVARLNGLSSEPLSEGRIPARSVNSDDFLRPHRHRHNCPLDHPAGCLARIQLRRATDQLPAFLRQSLYGRLCVGELGLLNEGFRLLRTTVGLLPV